MSIPLKEVGARARSVHDHFGTSGVPLRYRDRLEYGPFRYPLRYTVTSVLVTEKSRVRLPAGALPLPGSLGQLSLPSFPVGKSSTSVLAGVKAGRVYLCRVAGNTL